VSQHGAHHGSQVRRVTDPEEIRKLKEKHAMGGHHQAESHVVHHDAEEVEVVRHHDEGHEEQVVHED